jgi:general secretion pathway protein A
MVDALNRRLLAAHSEGRRVIVIVDEAQNLSADVLEQVRLLTNLETATQKLLQIILIGQPELRELLDRSELRQLAQRITGRYHLSPLSKQETQEYVRHRLRVAGAGGEIFTAAALREVYRLSSGIPRVINVCCDRALLGAYTLERREVTPALVRRAAGEVYDRRFAPLWLGWVAAAITLAGVAVIVYAGITVWRNQPQALRSANKTPALTAAAAHAEHPPVATAAAATIAATTAAAAAPGEKPLPLQALLVSNTTDTSDAAAFRRLLSLWGTAMADDHDPCGQAQKAGLACLDQRGSWAQVRALNRPAILTLSDDRGQRYRVVLSSLDDSYATLDLGEHNVRVPIDELSRDWFGEFTLVWKPKTPRTRQLSLGMRGDEVRWLRRSLNALHGAASDPDSDDVYDQDLAVAVQNFQREHRLNVDGIAGLQTQVVLDTALAEPGSPLLMQAAPRS